MTPDRRLDQLEPLMAESLQKIDRLIEGQGQILEIAARADQKADTTAKGLAELTISTQKQFEGLRAGQEQLRASQENLQASQDQLRAGQEDLKAGQDLILQILREKLP